MVPYREANLLARGASIFGRSGPTFILVIKDVHFRESLSFHLGKPQIP